MLPVDLTLSGSRYTTGQQRNAFYCGLTANIRTLPRVLAAGAISDAASKDRVPTHQEAPMSMVLRTFFQSVLAVVFIALGPALAPGQPIREPLPIEVVASLRSHNGRSPVDLSPDGEWLAHTYGRDETVPQTSAFFAASGFPFAEGNARMQAALTNTKTGQVIRLGGEKGSS